MEVFLPPDLQQFLADQVTSGVFPSTNDALCRAVEALRDNEVARNLRRAELFREIDLGVEEIERGDGIDVPLEGLDVFFTDIKRRGRQRLASRS
jgi:antitoxin ParD1/3/4